jgi:hypothetical protein
MDMGMSKRTLGGGVPADVDGGEDEQLIRLCLQFVRRADARTVEGDRLDGLPWTNEVNAGYLELSRGAPGYDAMLAAILSTRPRTVPGLVAKAGVISRHQRDRDAEPIPAQILAEDVIRLHGGAAPGMAGLDGGSSSRSDG